MENFLGLSVWRENRVESIEEVKNCEIVLVYFSGIWSMPCKNAAPHVLKLYRKLNKYSKVIEIVFISCDRNEEQFNENVLDMPWCYIPFREQGTREIITRHYEVSGIPMMILINKWGVSVSNTVMSDISLLSPANCLAAWREKLDIKS